MIYLIFPVEGIIIILLNIRRCRKKVWMCRKNASQ